MPNFDIYGKPIEDCKDFNMNDTSLPINEDSKDDFNLLPDNNREEPDDVPYGEISGEFVEEFQEESEEQFVDGFSEINEAVTDEEAVAVVPVAVEAAKEECVKENGKESAENIDVNAGGQKSLAEKAGENLIRLSGVDIFNGGNLILSNVHFEVDRGEFV